MTYNSRKRMHDNASGISQGSSSFGLGIPPAPPNSTRNYWQRHGFLSLGFNIVFAFLISVFSAPLAFGTSEPIHYVVDLRNPLSHKLVVTMVMAEAEPRTEIQFPTWNALYQIRDFIRNVQGISARCDGKPEELVSVDVNTWRSGAHPCPKLEITYGVYANEEGIFSSTLNADHS